LARASRASAKKLVIKTLEKYSSTEVSEEELKRIILANGYTLICFEQKAGKHNNAVLSLMKRADVLEKAKYLDAFLCVFEGRHLAFLRKDVSEKRYFYGLSYILGSIIIRKEYGENPDNPIDAHAFAHYLVQIATRGLIYNQFSLFPKGSIAVLVAFVFLFSFFVGRIFTEKVKGYENANTLSWANEPYFEEEVFSVQDVKNTDGISADEPTAEVFAAVLGEITPHENENGEILGIINNAENTEIPENKEEPGIEKFVTDENERVYYATKSGKKYHVAGCSYIVGKETKIITKEEIESGKYTPCSKCIG
jgi:hypothetical protein